AGSGVSNASAPTAVGGATLLNLASAVTVTDSVGGLNVLTITHAAGAGTTTFKFGDNPGGLAPTDGFFFQSTGDTGITVNSGGTGSVTNGFIQINETDNHL